MDKRDLKEGQEVYVKGRVIHTGDHLDIVLDEGSFIENAIILHREKPVVKQFVADWIEYCKINKISLGHALYRSEEAKDKRVYHWLVESLDNQDLFALAWIFGYTVEKEKLYTARLKIVTISYVNYINRRSADGAIILGDLNAASGNYQTSFTQSELEELNAWDNPAFEVEEVE
jgi:hypothetical protein